MMVAVSWNELPAYGARLLREGIESLRMPVEIVATRPTIPIRGMDEIVQQPIRWIPRSGVRSWAEIGLQVPTVFFQAGWYIDSFIHLGREVRRRDGKVVLLADNSWSNSPRQWVGSVVYRLKLRRQFDAVWVPGVAGSRLMRTFGVPKAQIFEGLYGSDPSTFPVGPPLGGRPKRFLYVGQLIERKGVLDLVRAFSELRKASSDWCLYLYGDGPLRTEVEGCDGVTIMPFAQPPEIAAAMRLSRFVVLPSISDHWPLVVSEAALSGCGLLLSSAVGNSGEFVGHHNGVVFKAGSIGAISSALSWAANLDESQSCAIADESRRRGLRFTPTSFAAAFVRIVHSLEAGARRPDEVMSTERYDEL